MDNVRSGGTLYVVATPIGNLEDITLRALRVLREADHVVSEDTRHTGNLLRHFGIKARLMSYYRERERERAEKIVALLQQGENIALVTDAGTPCISDPGAILVGSARAAGIPVVAIPGPSSFTAALSVCGFPVASFLYLGFPPPKQNQRLAFFSRLTTEEHLLVFFEAPHRLAASLTDAAVAFGVERQAVVCRELTKIHEEGRTGTLGVLRDHFAAQEKILGEIVIVVAGRDKAEMPDQTADAAALLRRCHDGESMTMKDAVSHTCRQLGLPRGDVYAMALEVFGK